MKKRDPDESSHKPPKDHAIQLSKSSSLADESKHNQNYMTSGKSPINSNINRQDTRNYHREQLIRVANQESKSIESTTSCGNMDLNPSHDHQTKCEACGARGYIDHYCGVSMCAKCTKFLAHMVEKKFKAKCKQDGKCDTTFNSAGKVRCKSCKLKSMIKLNVSHPEWDVYRKSLTEKTRINESSSLTSSKATPRPTPNGSSQLVFNDLAPMKLTTKQNTPQKTVNTLNTGLNVNTLNTNEKLEGAQISSRATKCRACDKSKNNSDNSPICESCIQFVVYVNSLGSKLECNNHGNARTSPANHFLDCISCKLDKINNVEAQTGRKDDHKCGQPIEERKQSSSYHTTSNHHGHSNKGEAQLVAKNPTTVNINFEGNTNRACQGCGNTSKVWKSFNLFFCKNCYEFIKANSACPRRFKQRCPREGRCNTRYKLGKRLCMSCRTRKLRKLDIQEPQWIKYRTRMGLIKKQQAKLTVGESSSSIVNPPTINQNRATTKHPNILASKRCRACSGPLRGQQFGGQILCRSCISFVKYTIEHVTNPIFCTRDGTCDIRYTPGVLTCRSCRVKYFIYKLKIREPEWMKFRKKYISQLKYHNLDEPRTDNSQPVNVNETPQATNPIPDRPQQSISNRVQPQPMSPSILTTQAQTSVRDEPINAKELDVKSFDCVACGGPSYLEKTSYALHLCISCVKFIDRMPIMKFNIKCRAKPGKFGKCRTTYLSDHPIKCNLCRVKRLLKLNIEHPAWIEYKSRICNGGSIAVNSEQRCDTVDPSYGVVCGICGNSRSVSRKSEEFSCCQNCWQFLTHAECRNFRDSCKTGKYNCNLEHVGSPQKGDAGKSTTLCKGCRIRRAIKIGFWDPKLINSPHKHLISWNESSEDGNSGSLGEKIAGDKNTDQTYNWCNDCETQFSIPHQPIGRLNSSSAEQDSGVCGSPSLQDCSAPQVDIICPTCQAKRAASLGLRVRQSTSPLKLREHEVARATDVRDERTGVKRSPIKDNQTWISNCSQQLQCAICNHTNHVRLFSAIGRPCCANCRQFLYSSSKKPNHTQQCITGKYECELKHIPVSEYNKNNRMCPGCRMRKAINLGYKPSKSSQQAQDSESSSSGPSSQQYDMSVASPVPSPIGSLFLEEDSDDDGGRGRVHSHAVDKQTSSVANDVDEDDDTIDVVYPEDDRSALHPSETRDRVLRRWFSCEVDLSSPSPEPAKTIEDEIFPKPEVQVIVFNNNIGGVDRMPLVTQDLNPTERPSVEELTVTKLHMEPSSSLRRTRTLEESDTIEKQLPVTKARHSKFKMTLTLKTLRTTVDRRPMLKKLKTSLDVHLRAPTPKQAMNGGCMSPPLIAPNEDCDLSDDEIVDIDCN